MKIFKYPIGLGSTILEIPEPAKILSVQVQDGMAVLYALADEEEKMVRKHITTIMTGQDADLFNSEYIGTLMLDGGMFVLHAFVEVD